MPHSMTGFGRAEGIAGGRRLTAEAKSVNNRYLDLRLCLPPELQARELELQARVKEKISRGRVELVLNWEPDPRPAALQWNRSLARGYLEAMRQMRDELGLPGQPDLALLLAQKDVMLKTEPEPVAEAAWAVIRRVVDACLEALVTSRAAEGRVLAQDLAGRLERVKVRLEFLRGRAGQAVAAYRERLEKRCREAAVEADPQRLAQELVFFTDRSDVSEELVRLAAHVEKFAEALAAPEPAGRKLDFLLQEMNREANTTGAKVQDAALSQEVVEIKTELERMREQVQNLE